MSNIGVYVLTNTINGMIYVGSSKSLNTRWSNHKSYFRKGIHHNKKMQNVWNKYGESVFSFSVIELTNDTENLVNLEQKWIDALNPCDRSVGYNILPLAFRQNRILGDCIICSKSNIIRRKGRCHACNEYFRKFNKERPYKNNGRVEKSLYKENEVCLKCKRQLNIVGSGIKGMCKSCYRRKDYVRTRHKWKGNKCENCQLIKKRTSKNILYCIGEDWTSLLPMCRVHHAANSRNTRQSKKKQLLLF